MYIHTSIYRDGDLFLRKWPMELGMAHPKSTGWPDRLQNSERVNGTFPVQREPAQRIPFSLRNLSIWFCLFVCFSLKAFNSLA